MWNVIVLLLFVLCEIYHVLSNTGMESTPTQRFIPCEKGWSFFEGKCFKIGGNGKDQIYVRRLDAARICASWNGTLASIHSQEQNDFLSIILEELDLHKYVSVHIGLKRNIGGRFIWEDGSHFNYSNWAPGEPNNKYFKEEFTVFHSGYKFKGKWNDVSYLFTGGYICQKSGNSSLNNTDPRFCPISRGGGLKFRDSCYKFIREKKSWMDAEEYCQNSLNGHLVTILDEERDYILSRMFPAFKNPLWIGIKIQPDPILKWTSGWFVAYEKFHNETKQIKEGNCILNWNQTVWTSVPCDEKYSFICEKTTVKAPVLKPPAVPSRCPESVSNLRDFGGEYCYYIDTKRNMSWFQSEIECIKMGGSLASIHSFDEERMLVHFVKNVHSVHIGLNSLLTDDYIFTWSDGSPLSYIHWGLNQPERGNEKCVDQHTEDMSWHDYLCNVEKGFICKVKKVQILPKEQVTAEAIRCTLSHGVFPAVYFVIFELLIIFAILAYTSRTWIKHNIVYRYFCSSPEPRKRQETASNENLVYVNKH